MLDFNDTLACVVDARPYAGGYSPGACQMIGPLGWRVKVTVGDDDYISQVVAQAAQKKAIRSGQRC